MPAFEPERLHNLEPKAQVDLWWDRDGKDKGDEQLVIRQDNGEKADVIIVTQGQAYDLLHAIACLIMDK